MSIEIATATIVPADRMIAINGEAYQSDAFVFTPPLPSIGIATMSGPPSRGLVLHAIQWFGDHGQIETSAGPAIPFTDRAIVAPYLPQWLKERAAENGRRSDQAAVQAAQAAAAVERLQAAQAALAEDVAATAADGTVIQAVKDGLAAHVAAVAAQLAVMQARKDTLAAAAATAEAKAEAAAAQDAKA